VLTGLRSIFHWKDNYLRFSGAREAVEAERRLYLTRAKPYDNDATRDQVLAAAVSRVEQEEMQGWIKVAAERPKA
jgi:methylphosphotriester-DNA--protein-cysteine methyltransferase